MNLEALRTFGEQLRASSEANATQDSPRNADLMAQRASQIEWAVARIEELEKIEAVMPKDRNGKPIYPTREMWGYEPFAMTTDLEPIPRVEAIAGVGARYIGDLLLTWVQDVTAGGEACIAVTDLYDSEEEARADRESLRKSSEDRVRALGGVARLMARERTRFTTGCGEPLTLEVMRQVNSDLQKHCPDAMVQIHDDITVDVPALQAAYRDACNRHERLFGCEAARRLVTEIEHSRHLRFEQSLRVVLEGVDTPEFADFSEDHPGDRKDDDG